MPDRDGGTLSRHYRNYPCRQDELETTTHTRGGEERRGRIESSRVVGSDRHMEIRPKRTTETIRVVSVVSSTSDSTPSSVSPPVCALVSFLCSDSGHTCRPSRLDRIKVDGVESNRVTDNGHRNSGTGNTQDTNKSKIEGETGWGECVCVLPHRATGVCIWSVMYGLFVCSFCVLCACLVCDGF